MRIELVIIALTALVGCRTDPTHPTGARAVGSPQSDAVVVVDDRTVTAAEIAEFAATRDAATLDALVERERRASDALARGVDVSFERKRAMVRALLEDEIEGQVGPESVPAEALERERKVAAAELRKPSGFVVTSLRVGSLDLIQRRGELSPERIEELRTLVRESAERLYAAVAADDGGDAVMALTWEWLDPALRVERWAELRVLDVAEAREAPKGWVVSHKFATQLENLQDGQKTTLIDQSDVHMFAVRKGRDDAPPVDAAVVEELAVARALKAKRKERFDALLGRLRDRTSVSIYPELLEEGR